VRIVRAAVVGLCLASAADPSRAAPDASAGAAAEARLSRRAEAERTRRYVRLARRRLKERRDRDAALDGRCRDASRAFRRGRVWEAYDLYRRTTLERPEHPAAARGLRRTVRRLGRLAERGRFPTPAHASAAAGLLRFAGGEWDGAAEALERTLEAAPLPDELRAANLAEYAAEARRRGEAERWARERESLLRDGREAYRAGRPSEALERFRAVLARDPADAEAGPAVALLEKLIAAARGPGAPASDDEAAAHMTQGVALYIQGRGEEARAEFRRVLELRPDHPEASEFLRELGSEAGEAPAAAPGPDGGAEAERLYRDGLRRFGEGRAAEAEESFRASLRADPSHEGARRALERLSAPAGR
jgi:tetratricopeptide (TPR) repeat protein